MSWSTTTKYKIFIQYGPEYLQEKEFEKLYKEIRFGTVEKFDIIPVISGTIRMLSTWREDEEGTLYRSNDYEIKNKRVNEDVFHEEMIIRDGILMRALGEMVREENIAPTVDEKYLEAE